MGAPPDSMPHSGRARGAVPVAVVCALALGAVAGALGVGPLSTSTTTAAKATTVSGRALPLDQWLATGRIYVAAGTNVVRTGDVLVRAWYFKKVCPAHGACSGQFIRQLSGGGAQTTNIQEGPGIADASFPQTIVGCGPGAATQGTEHDVYSWRQAPDNGRLDAVHEDATFAGCGP